MVLIKLDDEFDLMADRIWSWDLKKMDLMTQKEGKLLETYLGKMDCH